jgi:hypothetical protein
MTTTIITTWISTRHGDGGAPPRLKKSDASSDGLECV